MSWCIYCIKHNICISCYFSKLRWLSLLTLSIKEDMFSLSNTLNIVADGDLITPGARAASTMILTQYSWEGSVPEILDCKSWKINIDPNQCCFATMTYYLAKRWHVSVGLIVVCAKTRFCEVWNPISLFRACINLNIYAWYQGHIQNLFHALKILLYMVALYVIACLISILCKRGNSHVGILGCTDLPFLVYLNKLHFITRDYIIHGAWII